MAIRTRAGALGCWMCAMPILVGCGGDDDGGGSGTTGTGADGTAGDGSGSDGSSGDGGGSGSGGTSDGTTTGDGDTGGDGEPAGGKCAKACDTVDDCVLAWVHHDHDNYDCDQGACIYLGCNDTAECEEHSGNQEVVCADSGAGLYECVWRCQTPADCPVGSPGHLEHNYECREGACFWNGCSDHTDCGQPVFDDVCADDGSGPPDCVPGCQTVQDCIDNRPAFDEDNYECLQGGCIWTGCNDTAECEQSYTDPRVCYHG